MRRKSDPEINAVNNILRKMYNGNVTIKEMDKIASIIYDKKTGKKKDTFKNLI